MTFNRIQEIVKENYETGKHGGRHFEMSPILYRAFRERFPAISDASANANDVHTMWGISALGKLWDIPIVLDHVSKWKDNCWRLCIRSTIVEHGYVEHFLRAGRSPIPICQCGMEWPCEKYEDGQKTE